MFVTGRASRFDREWLIGRCDLSDGADCDGEPSKQALAGVEHTIGPEVRGHTAVRQGTDGDLPLNWAWTREGRFQSELIEDCRRGPGVPPSTTDTQFGDRQLPVLTPSGPLAALRFESSRFCRVLMRRAVGVVWRINLPSRTVTNTHHIVGGVRSWRGLQNEFLIALAQESSAYRQAGCGKLRVVQPALGSTPINSIIGRSRFCGLK
jgi:hypothetical protein